MKNGVYPKWTKYNDGYLCARCANKLFYPPRKTKEAIKKYNDRNNPIYNHRHLSFKGKSIFLKENPRKGVCSWCGRKNGEYFLNANLKPSITLTHMHHIEYHDDDPLKDTLELCASCHSKETQRMKKLK
jgi:hypothetical protein